MTDYYFAHARTALKFGILSLGLKENDEILIPNYICDVLLEPLIELKIKFQFYEIDRNFNPLWKNINSYLNIKTKAIIMVNYFGNLIDFDNFIKFSRKNNIFLIEDNAHGYSGKYNGKLLGKLSDIGISSPRKLIGLNSGAILHLNKSDLNLDNLNINLSEYNTKSKSRINFFLKSQFPTKLKKYIKRTYKRRPLYEDQNSFRESKIKSYLIDPKDYEIIKKTNWFELRKKRYEKYIFWKKFCQKNDLEAAFNNFNESLIPWCFPAYTSSHAESIKWFDWGWKNNEIIFSWPTLPLMHNMNNTNQYKRWQKMIFFSTE